VCVCVCWCECHADMSIVQLAAEREALLKLKEADCKEQVRVCVRVFVCSRVCAHRFHT
jgi:hypothetical protein